MKLKDIDRVNRLVSDLGDVKSLIETAEHVERDAYQVLVEAPANATIKMSRTGPSTSHSRGVAVSEDFLGRLKQLAVEELRSTRARILTDLRALGVETEG